MHLQQSKEYIAYEAGAAAKQAMRNHAAAGGLGYDMSSASLMGQLSDLIAKAVEAGVAEALRHMYTDDEFERDLTLKS